VRLGNGDLTTRLASRRRDELGVLARTFDHMASRLQETTVSKSWVDAIVRSMGEMLIVSNAQGRIESVNPAVEAELGWAGSELVGRCVDDLVLASDQPGELQFLRRDGSLVPVACEPSLLSDESKQVRGRVYAAWNITERKRSAEELRRSLAEKDVLLREVHHRVKNNLQVICSLLRLQATESVSADAARHLRDSESRIRSMALIHEQLYRSADVARIDFDSYVAGLTRNLVAAVRVVERPVTLRLEVQAIPLELDVAIPCGLVVNELVANALEHAFPSDAPGTVTVRFSCSEGQAVLEVQDDGVGFSPPANGSETLGLRLVRALAKQLRGAVTIDHGNGTHFRFAFPLASEGTPPT
jgi:two-component system, sensor histidine kinase PdtaS